MAPKVSAQKAAEIAIGSIGPGYDLALDLRLKYCIGDAKDTPLIEFEEVGCYDVALPDGISIPNVSKLIKCNQGKGMRNRSDVISFQQMEDISIIYKRRGGREEMNLSHAEWLHNVQVQPDVVSMSLIPITSLLSGVPMSGFLNHAINLYLRYKPPLEELHLFLEFQLPRQWAPVFKEFPFGSQHKRQSNS